MGDEAGAATCELRLGNYYLDSRPSRDAVPNALAACKRALAQSDEAYHTALCHELLSRIYLGVGRLDDARSLLDTAVKTLQKYGDRATVTKCLKSLASLHIHSKRRADACAVLRQVIAELTWLGRDLDAAFVKWRLGNMCDDDEEAVELYLEAIPQFYTSVFVYADAECRFSLGCRYMQMRRFSDALLHLEIARHQMILNGTLQLASKCLMVIIQAMCNDGNIEGAKLMLEGKMAEVRGYLIQQQHGAIQDQDFKLSIESGQLTFETSTGRSPDA
jgi:tetratricopeptide (TPR) repeat protein